MINLLRHGDRHAHEVQRDPSAVTTRAARGLFPAADHVIEIAAVIPLGSFCQNGGRAAARPRQADEDVRLSAVLAHLQIQAIYKESTGTRDFAFLVWRGAKMAQYASLLRSTGLAGAHYNASHFAIKGNDSGAQEHS